MIFQSVQTSQKSLDKLPPRAIDSSNEGCIYPVSAAEGFKFCWG